jgi:phosphomevalonate kinase
VNVQGKDLLTVPGNLLFMGEYAVLEEGGLGIGIAVERRVVVGMEKQGASRESRSTDKGSSSLMGAVVEAVGRELAARDREATVPTVRLRADSSALFDTEGRKLGLGSSAAVALGTALAYLRLAGLEGQALADSGFRAALSAHRAHQRGLGSGYDLATSLSGGYILFRGGTSPSYERIELPWMPRLGLLRGPAPVDTSRAVERYLEWRRSKGAAARDFLEASNEAVRGFAAAGSWGEAEPYALAAARLGLELGDALGVSARNEALEGRRGKSLGAGNELGATWGEELRGGEARAMELEVAKEGPRWIE